MVIAFYFGYGSMGALPDWIFSIGIFLMFLGVLVRQYAIATRLWRMVPTG